MKLFDLKVTLSICMNLLKQPINLYEFAKTANLIHRIVVGDTSFAVLSTSKNLTE
jgi:hypothetical protein